MGILNWLRGKLRPRPAATDDCEFDAVMAALDTEPKRSDVYTFQHRTLPQAVFDNHPTLIRELAAENATAPLLHFWMLAQIHCVDAGLLPRDTLDDGAAMQARYEAARPRPVEPWRRAGFTAYVYAMAPPVVTPECHFVAIVHKDDEPHDPGVPSPSTRYFTLERSVLPGQTVFCAWTADGAHLNFGSGPAPDLEAFAQLVLDRTTGVG